MIKIGILSFSENIHHGIVDLVESKICCKILGVSQFNKMVMVDDEYTFICSEDELIDNSDMVIVDSASSEQMYTIETIIKKTKHLYLLNIGKFTQGHTKELLNLSIEAGSKVLFSLPHRENPIIKEMQKHFSFPTLVNITDNGIHDSGDCLMYNKLIEKVDLLLMLTKSNIYRLTSCFSSDEFMNIGLEFDNSVNALITINQLTDEKKSWIEIISPGQNLKVDLKQSEMIKINKTGKNKLLKSYESCHSNSELLELEFAGFIERLLKNEDLNYDLTNYHFANILTEEILKKISYVLA